MNKFLVRKHKQAPLFNDAKDVNVIIEQLISEITGHVSSGNEVKEYLRQAGLVNLWFFLKYIAGFAGPYNEINDEIHLDMANFRQSDYCMGSGARAAGFVPRSFCKSTLWTHGADTWEIVRWPDIRIRLESGVASKAHEFIGNIKNTFESNELVHWLYPETKVPQGWDRKGNWSGDRLVIPSRTRHFTEATVTVGSMTGASEGGHFNLYNCDDPVGLDDLDSQRSSSVDMYRKKNRFITNKTALLVKPKRDRVILIGTRYAIDDIYDIAINDCKKFVGFKLPEFQERSDGEWTIYNRLAEEDGTYVNPETVNEEVLNKAMQEDMWFAMTQLMNYPQKTGLAEFNQMSPKFAQVEYDDKMDDFVVSYEVNVNYDEPGNEQVLLSDCDVVMSVDPAGTDKGISAKTSRTSIGIWARDCEDRVTRIFSKVGYFDVKGMFDGIFEGHNLYKGYVRATVVESNAMQKILLPLLRQEQNDRGVYINPVPYPATGGKVARIRNNVGSALSKGKLYLVRRYAKEFLEEHAIFPMNEYKLDVLDESEKGISATRTPLGGDGKFERQRYEDEVSMQVVNNVFGY